MREVTGKEPFPRTQLRLPGIQQMLYLLWMWNPCGLPPPPPHPHPAHPQPARVPPKQVAWWLSTQPLQRAAHLQLNQGTNTLSAGTFVIIARPRFFFLGGYTNISFWLPIQGQNTLSSKSMSPIHLCCIVYVWCAVLLWPHDIGSDSARLMAQYITGCYSWTGGSKPGSGHTRAPFSNQTDLQAWSPIDTLTFFMFTFIVCLQGVCIYRYFNPFFLSSSFFFKQSVSYI